MFKKNQIIIFAIALMLITAGYFNYTLNENSNYKTSSVMDSEEIAELGDAKLVSTSNLLENEININNEEENRIDYFEESRIEREKMYSQMIETYQSILKNTEISSEQKSISQNEIVNINNIKNGIMVSENLIKNKGIEDVVIFINVNSASAIVKGENIATEKISQIQNIINRELKIEISNIHISTK